MKGNVHELVEDAKKWVVFFDVTIGVVAINLGLLTFSTSDPFKGVIVGVVSVYFTIVLGNSIQSGFPEKILVLRNIANSPDHMHPQSDKQSAETTVGIIDKVFHRDHTAPFTIGILVLALSACYQVLSLHFQIFTDSWMSLISALMELIQG